MLLMLLPPICIHDMHLLRTKVKPLIRITSQQERGSFSNFKITQAVFKQSLTKKQTTKTLTIMCHCLRAHSMHIWREKGTDKRGLIADNRLDVALQMAISPVVSKWIQKNRCERKTMKTEGKKREIK